MTKNLDIWMQKIQFDFVFNRFAGVNDVCLRKTRVTRVFHNIEVAEVQPKSGEQPALGGIVEQKKRVTSKSYWTF